MLTRILHFSLRFRFAVLVAALALGLLGVWPCPSSSPAR